MFEVRFNAFNAQTPTGEWTRYVSLSGSTATAGYEVVLTDTGQVMYRRNFVAVDKGAINTPCGREVMAQFDRLRDLMAEWLRLNLIECHTKTKNPAANALWWEITDALREGVTV